MITRQMVGLVIAILGLYLTAVAYDWLPSTEDQSVDPQRRNWRKIVAPLMFVSGVLRILF